MAINYAEQYQKELDQLLTQEALSSELETQNVNWMGAKTFHVPHVAVSGYKPHSRNGGFNRGTVNVDFEPYTLKFDRDIEFFVDKADVDETDQAASAANVTGIFMREHGIPEMDAYRFSKLAQRAVADKNEITDPLDRGNIYAELKKALLPMRKYGPANLTAYLSSEAMDLLERSEDFNRKIEVTNNDQTIETRVTQLDGVRLKEVWDEQRLYTEYDFSDGFVPHEADPKDENDADAKKINFLIVARPAVIAKAKITSMYLFEPGQHTEGDGYLYQNRLYHDLFVMNHKQDPVFVATGGVDGGGVEG
ncbi:hypothetical protein [Kroppenstedtia sanguinis]|uniref:Phage major capsid protein n=1 Tax=Kroppenstedtia sanguinis TaxID=1380684 RepID=A0ABW4C6F8_9BACL